ncbi:MAG: hypothetical protein NXH88_19605 [Hyphomonas sp.]|nr:hypothetical protein [Hyphomonas sp.]
MSESVSQPKPDEADILKAQKRRNVWLAWALVAFVIIVGVTTAIRIQQTDFSGGDRLYFSGYLDEAEKDKRDREAIERARAAQAELDAPEPVVEEAEDE